MDEDLFAHARAIVDSIRDLTLATVDADGNPWSTPVYFAADDGLECFYWMSAETSQHSRNIAAHPAVGLAVFDSTVPPYFGRCVYASGVADALTGDELRSALDVYPGGGGARRICDHGGRRHRGLSMEASPRARVGALGAVPAGSASAVRTAWTRRRPPSAPARMTPESPPQDS